MIVLPPGDRIRLGQMALPELQRSIVQAKEASPAAYAYVSLEALLFELSLRSRIVESAQALYASGVKFATYKTSRCNEAYWHRTGEGGFRLRSGVAPTDAIRDIFANGSLYGFECSMAMVIVVYKAVLEQIPRSAFNTYFNNLYLYDWQYDSDLGFIQGNRMLGAYPGDIFYFKNPDHNPATPEWQGENGIMLGPDLFYGHGVGIKSSSGIIEALNRRRRPGSRVSAYMLDEVIYPNFEHIRRLSGVFARIGSSVYRRKQAV
ncbi:protein-glutamine gamma-glutamyltransferase [Paenibacillus oralis]|uniref:Protein-glutamine gamma-glutamyltransferase n=1 Tax=Paenibacillus oralis TaxID=2490856 RepID=A0A3P3TZC7_9BACL|nr:protein-glutamine gamma-glutamyltransferase [Paenibacillus oralis]RRJ63467.1 protein-glutamine gamma-glutamyltransferase [Paenibacillus oralis]